MQQFGYGSSQKLLKGAAYQFQCEDGASLVGSPTVFCDGRKWNDTAPTCISKYSQYKVSNQSFLADSIILVEVKANIFFVELPYILVDPNFRFQMASKV